MSKNKVYDKLLNEINRQLEAHKTIVKTGVIINACIVETALKPKTKPGYEIVEEYKVKSLADKVQQNLQPNQIQV